ESFRAFKGLPGQKMEQIPLSDEQRQKMGYLCLTQGGKAGMAYVKRIERERADRKSTRLNSSHVSISYAVFCLKKKKKEQEKSRNKATKTAINIGHISRARQSGILHTKGRLGTKVTLHLNRHLSNKQMHN